jgi:hypothetical protein
VTSQGMTHPSLPQDECHPCSRSVLSPMCPVYTLACRGRIAEEDRVRRTLKSFDYDLDAVCEYLQQQEAQSEKKAITLEPRRPTSQRKVS